MRLGRRYATFLKTAFEFPPVIWGNKQPDDFREKQLLRSCLDPTAVLLTLLHSHRTVDDATHAGLKQPADPSTGFCFVIRQNADTLSVQQVQSSFTHRGSRTANTVLLHLLGFQWLLSP